MGKKAVLKFFIFAFYAVADILTFLLLILPAWDNQENAKVGIMMTDNNGDLDFGYMGNPQANESSIYKMTVYTVVYLCIVALLVLALIGLTDLDKSRIVKWLHISLCLAHATGLVFIFLIYGIRYISQRAAPLKNYYLDIFGILIDFILILLFIIYKRNKNIDDVPMEDIQVEGGESEIPSRLSTKKTKVTGGDPQLISEGLATPLYVNGSEYVEPQPTVKAKPSVLDPNRIVVSDNIVGDEPYMDNNGNQFQYNPTQQIEVNTSPMTSPKLPPIQFNNQQPPMMDQQPPMMMDNQISPILPPAQGPIQSQTQAPLHPPVKLGSQYTYSESNAYPKTSDSVLKIPEIPIIGSSGNREIPEVPEVPEVPPKDVIDKDRIIM
ncbi:hypothetical protein PIROE2DRAFT_6832 [Piromyces sp. E2]|nr:hypothetical protein PIROE2DRAFT_6832 [Piromyces sp. E2]|eukprot:OUM66034.1 hypothetical protein PIROE2DRAFT_6832 [Piromyces sp. E2]